MAQNEIDLIIEQIPQNVIDVTEFSPNDYNDLYNKPKINNVELQGNKTSSDLGLASAAAVAAKQDALNSAQMDAVNSGIDSTKVGQIATNTAAIATKQDALSAAQLNAVNSGITSSLVTQIGTNQTNISTIEGKIPAAATSSNQMADKDYVNNSINSVAAYYITSDAGGDSFATKAALVAGPWYYNGASRTPTTNDYALVDADETHSDKVARYSYTGSQWAFQYTLNNMSFTPEQLAAINSGANTTNIGQIATNTTAIAAKQPKTLDTPITVGGVSQTTVEGALGAINTNTDGALKNTATANNSLCILGTVGSGTGTINIGKSNVVSWSADTVSIGNNSTTYGNNGVTVGVSSRGSGASVAIGAYSYIDQTYCTALGYSAKCTSSGGSGKTAIGAYSEADGQRSIAIGTGPSSAYKASATGTGAIQLGTGTNATSDTFQVYSYPMLDGTTGKIPAARLTDMVGADGVNAGTAGAVPAPTATDNTKFLRGDGTWAEAGGGSVSSPTLTWYTGQTGTTLTILDTSAAVCVKVYKNGVLLQPTQDYSIAGTTLTLTTALVATDKIIIEDSTMLDGSSLSNVVRSNDVAHIVRRTQAEYDALVEAGTVSATTFYIIVN